MTISDLIALANARLANLTAQLTSANALADAVRIAQLEEEIAKTQETLAALRGI
jgi:uncharacterized Rmd1/YagE family protein